MPMYRYVCENCGYEKVVMHSMNDSPAITCDKCGSVMRRSIGRVGVIFKGSGFYITDSRKSSSSTDESSTDQKTSDSKQITDTKAKV